MNLTTVTILSIFLLVESNRAIVQLRIIGGDDAEIEDFPYQVSVRYFGVHFCGGSIISDRHILTAAHCTFSGFWARLFGKHNMTVHSATSRSDKPGITHIVRSIHAHPDWTGDEENGYSNDIAVLTLNDSIVFDTHQQKINLPSHNVRNNEIANLTGWGMTSNSNLAHSKYLQKLEVTLLTDEKCRPLISHKIREKQLCALKSVGAGACHADSGGPLASNGELVGIVSFMDAAECAYGKPDIYTNVFAYKEFIESIMKKE